MPFSTGLRVIWVCCWTQFGRATGSIHAAPPLDGRCAAALPAACLRALLLLPPLTHRAGCAWRHWTTFPTTSQLPQRLPTPRTRRAAACLPPASPHLHGNTPHYAGERAHPARAIYGGGWFAARACLALRHNYAAPTLTPRAPPPCWLRLYLLSLPYL